ncbi:peptidyl-prolyl cis-trans isomerase FKBP3-like [Lineus longissimus]|uniref:peptidyl-prolyl cis-trans isomerase FKBP3-like n=1 Tax=Lineus longissimus TaxID=88925 RepID=UPI002B4F644D
MADNDVTPKYTPEQLAGDGVSKKELCGYLQEIASFQFMQTNGLKGSLANVAKKKSKTQLIEDHNKLFEEKAFRKEGEEDTTQKKTADVKTITEDTKKLTVQEPEEGPPKYEKRILKKGNKRDYPKKGDTIEVWYTGKLPNGDVFDTNVTSTKKTKKIPLRFKVGSGKVIKGWDEAVKSMSSGEKSEFIIKSEWCYGKKGLEGSIKPNTDLTFEIELYAILQC